MTTYTKQRYPALTQPLGDSASNYPASGYFAMHITYPDTEYDDAVIDWDYATNSNVGSAATWAQGLTILIRTPLATDGSAVVEKNNVIVVDLKSPVTQAADLGTEKAARIIAAKINSRREAQVGEHGVTRYLRARYVRMSGKPTHTGVPTFAVSTTKLRVEFDGGYNNGYPSDLPQSGTLTFTDTTESVSLTYTAISTVFRGSKNLTLGDSSGAPTSLADFTITGNLATLLDQVSDASNEPIVDSAVISVSGEPEKHTVVLSWEQNAPNSAGGYWAPANGGPVIQGLGASVPMWLATPKPMDGGNMGLPALNYDSRGSTAAAHSTNHGYVRFSIEGLNSCDLPDMPPPDYTVTSPSIHGTTKVDQTTTGSSNIKIEALEYGTSLNTATGDILSLTNGYQATASGNTPNIAADLSNLSNMTTPSAFISEGLRNDAGIYAPRPYYTAKSTNTVRVGGLHISNEERVFESISVIDDLGNELTLKGGSPFGTVIRDFKVQNTRVDPSSGDETTGPSVPDGRLEPNHTIQLPDPTDIPGQIFVRSSHDRVQAWSNMTWGLGGLTPPDPRAPGVKEDTGFPSQFDTHDRMLVFHCERVLHSDLSAKHGLTPHTTAGAVPSGSTRLYSAHRITDHAERGAVLSQTNNGTATGQPYPHHRIRFARQGHSFVTPLCHRGTPHAMRRQLHRSHGSAYTLMFEAETENKHFGFGSGKTQTSSLFELDALTTKGVSGYEYSTGSFSSDGLPMSEMTEGYRLPRIQGTYTGSTIVSELDYLFAPGQEQVATDGVGHLVRRAVPASAITTSPGPTNLAVTPTVLTGGSRYNVASEVAINGFVLSDYQLSGGRPEPATASYSGAGDYFVRGRSEGAITPRVATELATVPPLLHHDPDLLNMAARGINGAISTTHADLALLKKTDTTTGTIPDAFLCTWLAEYSHPALLGTVREHYMTFRYREAGMPRAYQYPAIRGLLLRNTSRTSTAAQAENAVPFERLYVQQWLQNYGYNGLNAGGHGTAEGLRSANSVLMGHTTLRESSGTLRILPRDFSGSVILPRLSRGEGIGDGINPEKDVGVVIYDTEGDHAFTKYVFPLNPMVAYDFSRRLPVRAWGVRTASDALDMLAGDPTEAVTAQQPVFGKGRFDGGIHDSVQRLPNATNHGASWLFPLNYGGVERSIPIGFVFSGHTMEATPMTSIVRQSNAPLQLSEDPLGIGATLGMTSAGLLKPTVMAAGMWDSTLKTAPLTAEPLNKGSDPFIDLVQYTGSNSYEQSQSQSAVSSLQFGVGGGFHHLRGNALHTNASAVDHSSSSNIHYPTNGWGFATESSGTITSLFPIPLSEISDHRQVQSRTEPRLGVVLETEGERHNNRNTSYTVTGTKAVSLHSDLIIGQQFPVMPSWTTNTRLTNAGMTTGSSGSVNITEPYNPPTWSPDTNAAKATNTFRIDAKTHAKDAWAVRGCADLPPWGGVFILRKTFLNRSETPILTTEVEGTSGNASASHPRQKYVDYIVRPVRPLKLYGFASDLLQDGWTQGARCSSSNTGNLAYQAFVRDGRYGVFEANTGRAVGGIKLISASEGTLSMDWPDANEYDVVWHLIPSASMLQFFKSDAPRRTIDGAFNPEIEARYSQTTHPGGGEPLYQSESRYANDGTGIGGDFAKQTQENEIAHTHMNTAMRLFPRFKVIDDYSTTIVLEDASLLPSSGTLFVVGSGKITYGAKSGNKLTSVTNSTGISDLTNYVLRYTDEVTPSVITDQRALILPLPIVPTFIDNSVVIAKQTTGTWRRYDSTNDKVLQTGLSYRGLLEYDPTDFIMVNQCPLQITGGTTTTLLKNYQSAMKVRTDGRLITESFCPPYLFNSGVRLRVANAESDDFSTTLFVRNIQGESLSDVGINPGDTLLGQFGYIGVRTSDATLMMLHDAAPELTGFNVTPTKQLISRDRDMASNLNAHPSLRLITDHSSIFTARKSKGLNVMEVIRNLSQIDGKQLVNENTGGLIYSSNVFDNRGSHIGLGSAIRKLAVSQMYDSPNEIVVVGDALAKNERVFVIVRDPERMRKEAGAGATSELVKTLRQDIPGLKTNKEALRLAKSLLSRSESGAPVVRIQDAFNASSIQPGEIVRLDLPTHGISGDFAVFESVHRYNKRTSDFVIAQYDKGIEGLISDLQAASGNTQPLDDPSSKVVEVFELSLASGVRIVATHRVLVRSMNKKGFVIGGKHSQGMGKIGVRDSNRRALPLGQSKSRYYLVR